MDVRECVYAREGEGGRKRARKKEIERKRKGKKERAREREQETGGEGVRLCERGDEGASDTQRMRLREIMRERESARTRDTARERERKRVCVRLSVFHCLFFPPLCMCVCMYVDEYTNVKCGGRVPQENDKTKRHLQYPPPLDHANAHSALAPAASPVSRAHRVRM